MEKAGEGELQEIGADLGTLHRLLAQDPRHVGDEGDLPAEAVVFRYPVSKGPFCQPAH